MNLKDAIVFRIEELCNHRKLNASSLAYLCGMDRSTVYSILGEKTKARKLLQLRKICDGLEITLGEFF